MRVCGGAERFAGAREARRAGVAYLPGDRKENAILKDMSVLGNATIVHLHTLSRCGWINRKKQSDAFGRMRVRLRIRCGRPAALIPTLPGGNQQKVVLAKWLTVRPRLLILDNPTQGVDVGANAEIYDMIRGFAADGAAVVVLTSETQEVLRVCDRAMVMFHGETAGWVGGETMTEQHIMYLATGGKKTESDGESV